MLTQVAKIPDNPVESADTAEKISLYQVDEDLPDRIRSNFRSAQTAKIALLLHLEDRWDDKAEILFKSFYSAVHNHLRFISVYMYVPLKLRLKHDSSGRLARFQEFESKASESQVMLAALLRKYYRSKEFFNIESVSEMRADVERVVEEMLQQLNRERVYLFPRYLSDK